MCSEASTWRTWCRYFRSNQHQGSISGVQNLSTGSVCLLLCRWKACNMACMQRAMNACVRHFVAHTCLCNGVTQDFTSCHVLLLLANISKFVTCDKMYQCQKFPKLHSRAFESNTIMFWCAVIWHRVQTYGLSAMGMLVWPLSIRCTVLQCSAENLARGRKLVSMVWEITAGVSAQLGMVAEQSNIPKLWHIRDPVHMLLHGVSQSIAVHCTWKVRTFM